jgi:hypothetical protein
MMWFMLLSALSIALSVVTGTVIYKMAGPQEEEDPDA